MNLCLCIFKLNSGFKRILIILENPQEIRLIYQGLFSNIANIYLFTENERIHHKMAKNLQQKKQFYSVSGRLRNYLTQYKRELSLPVQYENLLQSVDSYPLMDDQNEDTLWQTMVYDQHYGKEI